MKYPTIKQINYFFGIIPIKQYKKLTKKEYKKPETTLSGGGRKPALNKNYNINIKKIQDQK